MKPRMRPFSGSSSVFLCRILLVVILLQDISAQPCTNGRTLLFEDPRPQWQHPERWPPRIQDPPLPYPYECIRIVKVPEKPKTPHPVFFPYTVPIPWPTPSNGNISAPVPHTISTVPSIPAETPSDTYPLYIPVPQYKFIPLYYNVPDTSKNQPRPVKEILPAEPTPTSKPQVKPIPPTTEPSEPAQPQTSFPTRISVKTLPTNLRPKPSDFDRENQRPSKPKNLIPPLKHTWVPPPENLPEYIPPQPSFLHTRSSVPSSDEDRYDYVTYEPEYYTVADGHITYGPEIYSYYPDSYSRYDPYHFGPYFSRYNRPGIVTATDSTKYGTGYVTYGPDIVTYMEEAPVPSPKRPTLRPSKQPTYNTYESGSTFSTKPTLDEDGYFDYDPEIVTSTEEAPVVPPQRSPARAQPQQPSKQPSYVTYESGTETTSERKTGGKSSKTYSPGKVTYRKEAAVPTTHKRPTSAKPSRPPKLPPSSERPPYATYDSEIVTVTEPTKDESGYNTYGPDTVTYTEEALVPSSRKRPMFAKPSRPSYQPPSSDRTPYATYDSDIVTITEPTKDGGYATYGPDVVTYTEKAPVPFPLQRLTPAKLSRPSYQLPSSARPSYATYDSDIVTVTEPTKEESGYRTYGPDIITYTEKAPAPLPPMRPSPAKPPGPAYQPPSSDGTPYATYDSDIVTVTEPTKYESGYRTYGPDIVTYTEKAPAPPPTKRPKLAKLPRPSNQPSPFGRPPYAMYDSEFVTITEPSKDGSSYVTYEPDVVTYTDGSAAPTSKRSASEKESRSSIQPPQQPVTGSGMTSFTAPQTPEDEFEYYESEPSYYTVVEDPNGNEELVYNSDTAGHDGKPYTTADDVGALTH